MALRTNFSPVKTQSTSRAYKRVLPTRFLSFPVSKRIYFFHHQSKISQRKKILMAVLENKQQRLRFQQLIFIEERTIRLLFCDQCLFWCVKSAKTWNGRGSLPWWPAMLSDMLSCICMPKSKHLSVLKSEKKSKLSELNELEYLKTPSQMSSFANWHAFLYWLV